MRDKGYFQKKAFCKKCNRPMELEDIDYNFEGNQDEIYSCECGLACFVKVRYGKIVNIKWQRG